MLSSQNVMIVKIPFRSRVMAFSNNYSLFVLMGKAIFDWQHAMVQESHRRYTTSRQSLVRKWTN